MEEVLRFYYASPRNPIGREGDYYTSADLDPVFGKLLAGQFERANQVIATGNYDYGIQLLISCCKLEPANLIYRQKLRKTEKKKFIPSTIVKQMKAEGFAFSTV